MTTATEAGGRSSVPLDVLLRRAAIPAAAQTMVDLDSLRPVAVKIGTRDPSEPMDAVTMARCLRTIANGRGRPEIPVVFDAPIGTLINLTSAGLHSEHPLIVSLDADTMLDHPAESLRLVERARELGWEIGLHGVGSTPAGLAAVHVFEPSLITLAPQVLADPSSPLAIEMLQTVTAFRHATGATVLAEGINSPVLRHLARSLGATIGWGSAVPSTGQELPSELDYTLDLFVSPRLPVHSRSPLELCLQRHQSQRAHPHLLNAISRKIERTAAGAGRSAVVLSAFQHARRIGAPTRQRYAELSQRAELVLMTAGGLRSAPAPGVAWADLARHDTLRREWTVLLVAPTTALLLAAREVRGSGRDADREFDYVLSYDRDLVAHAARSLLTRVTRRPR